MDFPSEEKGWHKRPGLFASDHQSAHKNKSKCYMIEHNTERYPEYEFVFGNVAVGCCCMSARMPLQLPRVAIEAWVSGTVAVPTFHCRKCLTHWRQYGDLPQECNELEEKVEGPPMYLTGKADFVSRMPVRNAYNSRDSQLQICIDVTAGRLSRAEGSEIDLESLETTDVDADALWDLKTNKLNHSLSDDCVADDDIQFLSHSVMSTGGHGTMGSATSTTQLPPIIVRSDGNQAAQVTPSWSHSVLAESLVVQEGSDYPPSMHKQLGNSNSDNKRVHGGDEVGYSGLDSARYKGRKSGGDGREQLGNSNSDNKHVHGGDEVGYSRRDSARYKGRKSGGDGKGHHSISAKSQDSRAAPCDGRMGSKGQGRMMGSSKDSVCGNGEVSHSGHGDHTGGSDMMHYSTSQEQHSQHSLLGSGHRSKSSNGRNAGSGRINGSSPSSGPLQTAGRIGSPALASEDTVGSTKAGNSRNSTPNQQSLHTSSSGHYTQSFHDDKLPSFTGTHEASSDTKEQNGRPEHQNSQSPASSRSAMPAAEPPIQSCKRKPGSMASGKGQPSLGHSTAREKKVVRQATIKENVEYVPDKGRVGKKKKAQLGKGTHPTSNSQATSHQGSTRKRKDSYVLAQEGSQSWMHQIDTSKKLEEQRQSEAAVAHGMAAVPPRTLLNATKSRDVNFPTRHNSKNLDDVVHQSPDLYHNEANIQPSSQTASEGGSHSPTTSSGWREQADLQTDQKASSLSTKDEDVSVRTGTIDTAGGELLASKDHDRTLMFSHGTGSDTSAVESTRLDERLQQQSQALAAATRSRSGGKPSGAQDHSPRGKATHDTQKTITASTPTAGTASGVNGSDDTIDAQVESKLSKGMGSEECLETISETSEGDETLAELEYYSRVRPPSFDIMSVMNFTRSFTYSMFPMSKQHKETYKAIRTSASTTGR